MLVWIVEGSSKVTTERESMLVPVERSATMMLKKGYRGLKMTIGLDGLKTRGLGDRWPSGLLARKDYCERGGGEVVGIWNQLLSLGLQA